jgi:hypothetical protein
MKLRVPIDVPGAALPLNAIETLGIAVSDTVAPTGVGPNSGVVTTPVTADVGVKVAVPGVRTSPGTSYMVKNDGTHPRLPTVHEGGLSIISLELNSNVYVQM